MLFGGSFNPFHNGHLAMARSAHAFLPHAQVVLIPAGSPPHKQNHTILSFKHREAMLQALATQQGPWLEVSDIEERRQGPTYTIDTVRAFQEERPGTVYFLIGGDSLRDMPKWYQFQDLIAEIQLLVIERPGTNTEAALQSLAAHISPQQLSELRQHLVPMEPIEISSTEIRDAAAKGQNPHQRLPAVIAKYLDQHQLWDDLA